MRKVLDVRPGDWLKRTLTNRVRPGCNGIDLIYVESVENGIAKMHRMDPQADGSHRIGRTTTRKTVDFYHSDFERVPPPPQPVTQQALPLPAAPPDASTALLRELLNAERERASRAEKRLAVVEAELARARA